MQIEVQTQGLNLPDDLRCRVISKLRGALKRVEAKVRDVRVKLTEGSSRRTGKQIHCHVQVRLADLRSVVIQDGRAQLEAAIDSTAERLRRTLTWAVLRKRPTAKRAAAISPRTPRHYVPALDVSCSA